MPQYLFICNECGTHAEVTRPMSESAKPVVCEVCEEVMARDYQGEGTKGKTGELAPWRSWAAGFHTSQVPEARELYKDLDVKINDWGTVTDCPGKNRKKFLERRGLHDKSTPPVKSSSTKTFKEVDGKNQWI